MKKIGSILLTAMLVISTLTACGKEQSTDVVINEKFANEEMTTISGKKVTLNDEVDITTTSDFGFALSLSDGYKDNAIEKLDFMYGAPYSLVASYLPEKIQREMIELQKSDEVTEEVQMKMIELIDSGFDLFSILRVNKNDSESKSYLESSKEYYKNCEQLAINGDDTYYFLYNDEIPENDYFTDEEKEISNQLVAALPTIKENIILFPPAEQNSEDEKNSKSVGTFATKDLAGNDTTESVFQDYDITMVNIWATWCGFCVDEMPELQKLYEQLPNNVNLISICTDGDTEGELAKEILEKKNVKFTALISNEEMHKAFLDNYPSLPTTIFVDRDGNIVGDIISGVPGRNEEIVKAYLEAINNALDAVNK